MESLKLRWTYSIETPKAKFDTHHSPLGWINFQTLTSSIRSSLAVFKTSTERTDLALNFSIRMVDPKGQGHWPG